jgi:hypothetical protein
LNTRDPTTGAHLSIAEACAPFSFLEVFVPTIPQDVIWAILSAAIAAMAVATWQYVAMLRKVVADNERLNWVAIAVDAAEQMLGDQAGQTRLDWVMTQLKARYPRLDTTTVRAMVEAHVKRMNQVQP